MGLDPPTQAGPDVAQDLRRARHPQDARRRGRDVFRRVRQRPVLLHDPLGWPPELARARRLRSVVGFGGAWLRPSCRAPKSISWLTMPDELRIGRARQVLGIEEQRLYGERSDGLRADASLPKRLDHSGPQPRIVGAVQLEVGRDHRPQEIAEGGIHRRQIVGRADAHRQHRLRRAHALPGQAVDQVGLQLAFGQAPAAAGREPQQVARAPLVRAHEAFEHRRYQDPAEVVGLLRAREERRIGLSRNAPQGPALARGRAELGTDVQEAVLRIEHVPPRFPDRGRDDFGEGQALEHRHDVGECLVQGRYLGIGRLVVVLLEPPERRVRHLVSHDVVRETREDELPREVRAGIVLIGREIAKEYRVQLIVEIGVARLEGVRNEPKAIPAAESQPATQRAVEILEHLRRYRVHHLLVKLGVVLQRLQPLRHGDLFIVQVHGAKVAPRRGVVVHDLQPIVVEETLPALDHAVGHLDGDPMVAGSREHRVEGKYAKGTALRPGIEWRLSHDRPRPAPRGAERLRLKPGAGTLRAGLGRCQGHCGEARLCHRVNFRSTITPGAMV